MHYSGLLDPGALFILPHALAGLSLIYNTCGTIYLYTMEQMNVVLNKIANLLDSVYMAIGGLDWWTGLVDWTTTGTE